MEMFNNVMMIGYFLRHRQHKRSKNFETTLTSWIDYLPAMTCGMARAGSKLQDWIISKKAKVANKREWQKV
jgi:hypothetical protein